MHRMRSFLPSIIGGTQLFGLSSLYLANSTTTNSSNRVFCNESSTSSDKNPTGIDEEPKKEELPQRPVWDFKVVEGNYSALFLDRDSVSKLKTRFFNDESESKEINELLHSTIIYQPSREEVLDHDDLLTEDDTIHVLGYAGDDHAKVLLVEFENPHIKSRNRFAHITLASEGGDSIYQNKYSNILLSRLYAEPECRPLFRLISGSGSKVWEGELPEAGIYTKTTAKFVNVEDEKITLNGTYCLSSEWNDEECKCEYIRENECSFCKYMKAGPCRQVFTKWEKCVAVSKESEDGDDFIERCATQTLDLKNCVDENPEYYNILGEEEKKEDENTEEEN